MAHIIAVWKVHDEKIMTNNPDGFQKRDQGKRRKLEGANSFKYLGSVISNELSKLEVLSRIVQTTATLPRMKIIGSNNRISLAS